MEDFDDLNCSKKKEGERRGAKRKKREGREERVKEREQREAEGEKREEKCLQNFTPDSDCYCSFSVIVSNRQLDWLLSPSFSPGSMLAANLKNKKFASDYFQI